MELLWWHWLAIGLVLGALELVSPGGFYILFFGVGAFATGLLALAGLGGPGWLQWLLFTAISIASLVLFRNPLMRRFQGSTAASDAVDTLVGEVAFALDDIAPGAYGRAELRGTAWSARNDDSRQVVRGERCIVNRVDGLTLFVRAEGAR
jgi:inner membrane protein